MPIAFDLIPYLAMKNNKLLIGPGTVVTFGKENKILQSSGILVEDDEIKEIGEWKELEEKNKSAMMLDADGRVIIPGLINAHTHLYNSFARWIGMPGEDSNNLQNIPDKLQSKLERALQVEDCYLSAVVPIIQGLKKGVTTYIDHHCSPFYRDTTPLGCLDEVGQAVIDLGVRACLCCEVSDRDGEMITLSEISENERFIEMTRSGHGGGRLSSMIGLHSQFTCSDETLEAVRQLDSYEKAGIHVHCAETLSDVEDARSRGFEGAVARLAEFNLLTEKTILANCVHLTEKEIELISNSSSAVVYQNAVGAADIIKLMKKEITVGVGTDEISPNLLGDFKTSAGLQHHKKKYSHAGLSEPIKLLTEGNPAIASRYFEKPVGMIEAGSYADIAVMDYYPPTHLAKESFDEHLLSELLNSDAMHTICHGKVIIKDKKLKGNFDEEALSELAKEHAEDLRQRII